MTDKTIFEGEVPATPEANPQPTTPAIPPELTDWVGEGKKYRSVEEVYKAFPNAQQHISTLEQKMQELEAELSKRKSAEEILEEIRSKQQPDQQKPTSQGVEVNESVLSELVERKLNERVTLQKQEDNLTKVVSVFTEAFADKRESEYKRIAEENNLSVAEMNQLAAKSPELVLNLAGLKNKPRGNSAINSDVNTVALTNAPRQEQSQVTQVPQFFTSKDLRESVKAIRAEIEKQTT